ncbi:MAG: hypothetical protein AB1689_07360, partial [Thermodesulfobacteriota bacterium]
MLALVLLLGCFGTSVIDLGSPADVGYAVTSSQGYIYTAGLAHGQYGVARVNGSTGALSPGTAEQPWGFGLDAPPSPPVGWVGFNPGGGNVNATSMAIHNGAIYVTGSASGVLYNRAGFGVVSLLNGTASNVKTFSPTDENNFGGYLAQATGGDIFVVG